MKDFFLQMKEKILGADDNASGDDSSYVEVNTAAKEEKQKVSIRPFVIEEFEDIKEVLDVLRDGTTIALVNIKPLKEKDIVELKRAISKLRKTCEAIDGDIAGIGEDYVVAAPYFARVFRGRPSAVASNVSNDEN